MFIYVVRKCIGLGLSWCDVFDVWCYIIYYYILYYYYILLLYIYYYILYYTLLFFLSSFSSSPSPLLIYLPFFSPIPLSSSYFPSSSSSPLIPFLLFCSYLLPHLSLYNHLIQSIRVGTYIRLFIFKTQSDNSTPHKLTEWMVEV